MPLIECVPNVSEGRRANVIEALAATISGPGAHLLDQSSDASHNRTVYTFAGNPIGVQAALVRLVTAAVDAIDLRQHEGVHPRIGAVDVVPFVPLNNATMEDCIELAASTGAAIADQLRIPVFLYEEAARKDDRRSLSDIRRGGLAGLTYRMRDAAWQPDFGPSQMHPSAGATAIGARPILIAYNVNLASNRLGVAKRIASAIRTSSGGFSHVKAIGVHLDNGIAQVSMNLTNYRETPLATVFDAVAREAAVDGVRILESEIVGLVPADALPTDPRKRIKLREADLDRILEARLKQAGLRLS